MKSRRRAGFTLVELTLSVVVMAMAMAAVSSAIALTARTMDQGSRGAMGTIRAAQTLRAICDHLTESIDASWTSRSLTLTLEDLDGDSADDTVEYSWSGVVGDPLQVRVNGGDWADILPDVRDFVLTPRMSDEEASGRLVLLLLRMRLQAGDHPVVRTTCIVPNTP